MDRVATRTPAAWRTFDRANIVVLLALALLLVLTWLAGRGPDVTACCAVGGASRDGVASPVTAPRIADAERGTAVAPPPAPVAAVPPAPATAALPAPAAAAPAAPSRAAAPPPAAIAPAPDAARAPARALRDATIGLSASDGRVRLSGTVPDFETRRALVADAVAVFGVGRVIDGLQIDAEVRRAPWLGAARSVLGQLRSAGPSAAITVGPGQATLEGVAPSGAARQAMGRDLAAVLGPDVPVDNRVAVVGGAAPIAVDCNRLTEGARVPFASGSAALTAAGRATLDAIAQCLGAGRYEIGGHTDASGTAAANLTLSSRRALAAIDHLVQRAGVAPDRLVPRGYGQTQPIADNASAAGRAQNRRLSFRPIAP